MVGTAGAASFQAAMTTDSLVHQAESLAGSLGQVAAAKKIVEIAGSDRGAIEAARDEVAIHLHDQVDDFAATAALGALNRALSQMPRVDPMDWRERWSRHRKP
jgi:hypothetical protein